jgi:multiple sugar transport system substrate-binding protein
MPAPETTPTASNGFTPGRRSMLKGLGAGAAGIAAFPLLAACTGGSSPTATTSTTAAGTGTATGAATTGAAQKGLKSSFGSNASDAVPKKAYANVVTAFEAASGDTITTNTVDHNSFQDKINNYLQGSPDPVFTWFAGYRMKYYAAKGLVAPLDDVWAEIGADNFGQGIQTASTGDDGKKYFIPNYNYPWAIFYRKSVWAAKGYVVPTTFDQLKTLCTQMKKDGITPIAFADKDLWPACGTFDYINMRLNGYQFHVDLMAHKESWDQQKVKDVFDNWKALLPFQDQGALGLTWQEGATTLANKKSGMLLLGSFVTQQFTDPTVLADIDFFPFPSMTEANGQDAVEAPIDGFMVSKRGADNGAAKAFAAFIGTAAGQNAYQKIDTSNIATNKLADNSAYSALTKKAQTTIANAKYISQFLDRDSLPAFASNAMEPALQSFLKSGNFDTKNVEAQAKTLYAAQ